MSILIVGADPHRIKAITPRLSLLWDELETVFYRLVLTDSGKKCRRTLCV